MRNGVVGPPCASNKVFVAPFGAPRIRLPMDSVVGKPLAVVASLFTVLVPALVIKTSACPLKGGTPSDQLAPDSHLPLTLLVQLFVLPVAVMSRACENSVP